MRFRVLIVSCALVVTAQLVLAQTLEDRVASLEVQVKVIHIRPVARRSRARMVAKHRLPMVYERLKPYERVFT